MATGNIVKFSLLIVAVFLSSYVCYTEAVDRCPLAPTATPTQIRECYNCTVKKCQDAYAACSGPNCTKLQPGMDILSIQVYIALDVLITSSCSSTSCPVSIYAIVDALVTLVALVITLALSVVSVVSITLVYLTTIVGLITALLNILIALLVALGSAAAVQLQLQITVFCNTIISLCASFVV